MTTWPDAPVVRSPQGSGAPGVGHGNGGSPKPRCAGEPDADSRQPPISSLAIWSFVQFGGMLGCVHGVWSCACATLTGAPNADTARTWAASTPRALITALHRRAVAVLRSPTEDQ